ncbi:hypothetical protein KXR63_11325 [Stutzerimonas chloritidismutans]|uniref:hypothetical protein n=1 Tax=Stutzerimonas chloritidismutans TaxID=203192 RepID=UPI003F1399BE
MYVYVRLMRDHGRPIEPRKRRSTPPIYGDVRIETSRSEDLGRQSEIARLVQSNPLESSVIPPLLDVALHGMSTNGFVLTGYEIIDGVAYAQSWWCLAEDGSADT